MTLGFILGVMTGATFVVLLPLLRRRTAEGPGSAYALEVYRDQLRETDDNLKSSLITLDEAQASRQEIMRRILTSTSGDGERPEQESWRGRKIAAVAICVVIPILGFTIYAVQGSPDQLGRPFVASQPGPQNTQGSPFVANQPQPQGTQGESQAPQSVGDVTTMVQRLADRLRDEPNDPDGWRTLGWSYLQTGRYQESAEAYERAVDLRGDVAELRSSYGEALVRAASGQVTVEALIAFKDALAIDLKDPKARFFVGLFKEQSGDKAGALEDWDTIIRDAPLDSPWLPDLRMRTATLAQELGVELESTDLQSTTTPKISGPTAEDIENAQAMSPGEQQSMINGMVERLAQRLEENPEDYEGWIKLARSRKVLGQEDEARTAIRRASEVFADAPEILRRIGEAAQQLGIDMSRSD